MAQENMTVLKKLNIKVIAGLKTKDDVKEFMRNAAKGKKPIARMVGRIEGLDAGKKTTFGDSTVFYGSFFAINLESGEVFEADQCYVPSKDMTSRLASAFTNRREEDAVIGFDFVVSVVESEASGVGYAYVCASEKSPEQLSAREKLLEVIGNTKMLPKPKK